MGHSYENTGTGAGAKVIELMIGGRGALRVAGHISYACSRSC
jgi:hypothetical protein